MNPKEQDDTLPLRGFSEELSVDVTADEDFIPTSQPQSSGSSKGAKNSDSIDQKFEEGGSELAPELNPELSSVIDETIPVDQSVDRDKSTDFIPETETKKRRMEHTEEEPICKRKLPVDNFAKCTEDIFGSQGSSRWDSEVSKIPESPVLETCSIIDESRGQIYTSDDVSKNCGESSAEILVNDSAETVDLDESEISTKAKSLREEKEISDRVDVSYCSDVERRDAEETQIFDNSSVLLLDQQEPSPISKLDYLKKEKTSEETLSQKLYATETVEDNRLTPDFEKVPKESVSGTPFPAARELSKVLSMGDSIEDLEIPKRDGISFKQEHQRNSTPKTPPEIFSPPSLVVKEMVFKLSVTCLATVNTKTKEVLQKKVTNVSEIQKRKPKFTYLDHNSDNTSDKSQRYSTSSSGSIYSDKTGLPFALSKRISAVSDRTDTSDSSEENLAKLRLIDKQASERLPWTREYLLPMKMDELMKVCIEKEDITNRPISRRPLRKFEELNCNGLNNLKEEASENSSPEHTPNGNLEEGAGNSSAGNSLEEAQEKENDESLKSLQEEEEEKEEEESPEKIAHDEESKLDEEINREREAIAESGNSQPEEGNGEQREVRADFSGDVKNGEGDSAQLRDGLFVFARWTDKRYYPGVLEGTPKHDRWAVKFDDGTTKAIREDFVMPRNWLKVGELVFALDDDKYVSGQIVNIKPGEEVTYTVELDSGNKQVCVRASDLCLTEVMAGIVKEKYKPLTATPRGKSTSDIDFDNVLTGKRLREQRTPLRPASTGQVGSSSAKKKSYSKLKKDEANFSAGKASDPRGETTAKESPQKKIPGNKESAKKIRGLQSENGHLVEDKVNSTDSPSETGETPLRSTSKEARGKAKPRSLRYEDNWNDCGTRKAKTSDWLSPNGTPIPGPSGVKPKKQRTKTASSEKVEASSNKSAKSDSVSALEENRTSQRATRSGSGHQTPGSEKSNSRSGKKSPGSSKDSSSVEKSKGKRNYKMDSGEETAEDGENGGKSSAARTLRKKMKTVKP